MYERIPPHNVEAEQAVLGAMIMDDKAKTKALSILEVNDFYLEKHKLIFAVASFSAEFDIISVSEELKKKGNLERIGDIEYLSKLIDTAVISSSVTKNSKIIKDNKKYRDFIDASSSILDAAYNQSESLVDLKAKAFESLDISVTDGDNCVEIRNVVKEYWQVLKNRKANKGANIKTGLPWVDKRTNGLDKKNLIILAARPSVGKTTLAIQIARFNAYAGKKILFFSLEMSRTQVIEKMIAADCYINTEYLKMPSMLKDEENKKIIASGAEISETKFKIYDEITYLEELSMISIQQKAEFGIDLIVIDYLQMMDTRKKTNNTNDKVGHITKNLKQLAKKCDCPIICLAQLHRTETNREPILTDLRDSGNIEQDADVVFFLHDPEMNNYKDGVSPQIMDLLFIIAKQREGVRDVKKRLTYHKPQQLVVETEG